MEFCISETGNRSWRLICDEAAHLPRIHAGANFLFHIVANGYSVQEFASHAGGLIMDASVYRWDKLPTDKPMALLERRRVIGEKAMISQVRLEKGCDVPMHTHENEQFACLMSGRMRFGLGAEGSPQRREIILNAGEVLHLPSNLPHSAFALEECLILDIFSPPSAKTGIDRH